MALEDYKSNTHPAFAQEEVDFFHAVDPLVSRHYDKLHKDHGAIVEKVQEMHPNLGKKLHDQIIYAAVILFGAVQSEEEIVKLYNMYQAASKQHDIRMNASKQ